MKNITSGLWHHNAFTISGADIIGLNCQYDPTTCITTIKMMKAGLEAEGLKGFLMLQPLGFHVPEVENTKAGYHELPEFPFGRIIHVRRNRVVSHSLLPTYIELYILFTLLSKRSVH